MSNKATERPEYLRNERERNARKVKHSVQYQLEITAADKKAARIAGMNAAACKSFQSPYKNPILAELWEESRSNQMRIDFGQELWYS